MSSFPCAFFSRITAKLTCALRPFVYGLAIGGKLGARDAVRGLLAVSFPVLHTRVGVSVSFDAQDLDQSMGLAGIQNISGCNRSVIRKVQYGGDKISSY